MRNRTIQLLDCTLRDGGFALEDAYENEVADLGFSKSEKNTVIEHLVWGG